MDPRRLLILTVAGPTLAGWGLSGCALLREARPDTPAVLETPDIAGAPVWPEADALAVPDESRPGLAAPADPAPEPRDQQPPATAAAPYPAATGPGPVPARVTGRRAITAANLEARAASASDAFIGGVQVFAWSPGRVYEIWTAPLRVTTLTLGPGETLVAKAAGDTVRWQIGETTSGEGAGRRSHVLIKPLQRGLETNLVLTTSRRVYFLDLKSGGVESFNAAIAWDAGDLETAGTWASLQDGTGRVPDPVVTPDIASDRPLDARYRIEPRGRRPRWTPTSVFNDGQRTFIAFSTDLQIDEAPVLFVIASDGEAQMVNYRQAGGLFIVDRVFDRAELRLGDRRPQVVRIRRLQGEAR